MEPLVQKFIAMGMSPEDAERAADQLLAQMQLQQQAQQAQQAETARLLMSGVAQQEVTRMRGMEPHALARAALNQHFNDAIAASNAAADSARERSRAAPSYVAPPEPVQADDKTRASRIRHYRDVTSRVAAGKPVAAHDVMFMNEVHRQMAARAAKLTDLPATHHSDVASDTAVDDPDATKLDFTGGSAPPPKD